MKSIILTIILALGVMSIFTACERNDYQHPLHRSK
jgi:hypothetical protein